MAVLSVDRRMMLPELASRNARRSLDAVVTVAYSAAKLARSLVRVWLVTVKSSRAWSRFGEAWL